MIINTSNCSHLNLLTNWYKRWEVMWEMKAKIRTYHPFLLMDGLNWAIKYKVLLTLLHIFIICLVRFVKVRTWKILREIDITSSNVIYIIRNFPHLYLFIISEQLSVETNIQERQKPRKIYNRNDDVRPTTEAKVLDFKDKDATTSMGGNMTDVLVESTYEQLVMAYRSANKVSIKT